MLGMGALVYGYGDGQSAWGSDLIAIAIPHWLVTLLLAVLPALYLGAAILSRSHRAGLCPKCGYDLRATPDRCPECGALPPPHNRPTQPTAAASSGAVE